MRCAISLFIVSQLTRLKPQMPIKSQFNAPTMVMMSAIKVIMFFSFALVNLAPSVGSSLSKVTRSILVKQK